MPAKVELKEGQAYVRYEGVTYTVSLTYFKLEANPGLTEIQVNGVVRK